MAISVELHKRVYGNSFPLQNFTMAPRYGAPAAHRDQAFGDAAGCHGRCAVWQRHAGGNGGGANYRQERAMPATARVAAFAGPG